MKPGPLLSVIIPTRERAETLASTLGSALDQKTTDFDVIVSDNASADATAEIVQAVADPRVRYVNTGKRVSMCDNYEFGLEQARGEYVIIIGDDDAVIPGGLDYLLPILGRLERPTIHMWLRHDYDWPVGDRPAELPFVADQTPARLIDLKAKARWVMRMGGWKYYELPCPYHSVVPRQFLDGIRERTGRVFHSTQPDVFTTFALPAFTDTAVHLGKTVTMNGRSASSNGLGFVNKAAHSNIDRFIREYGDYRFHPTLSPKLSPRANMIPDAILMAKDMFPEIYGDVEFGYEGMLAYMCRLGFASHGEVLRKAPELRKRHPLSIPAFLKNSAVHEAARLRRTLLNRKASADEVRRGVPDNVHGVAKRLAKQLPLS